MKTTITTILFTIFLTTITWAQDPTQPLNSNPTEEAARADELKEKLEQLGSDECASFNCDVEAQSNNNHPSKVTRINAQGASDYTAAVKQEMNLYYGSDLKNPKDDTSIYVDNQFDVNFTQKSTADEFNEVVSQLEILKNTTIANKAKAAVAKAGAEALGHGMRAALYNKQASKVKDAIKDINSFNPNDVNIPEDQLLIAKCQLEPQLPECGSLLGYQDRGFNGFDVSIGGGAPNQATVAPQVLDGFNIDDPNALSDYENNIPKGGLGIGGVGDGLNKGDGLYGVTGAAKVQAGGSGPAGSGGAAGGAGGASAPSNTNRPNTDNGPTPSRGADKSKLAYDGSRLRYASGRLDSRGAAKTTTDNPFKNFFPNNNAELKFRDPAAIGKQGSNLFIQISKRYEKIGQDPDRLLQYEKIK